MAFIKKNIWDLFLVIAFLSLLAYLGSCLYVWNNLIQETQNQLKTEVGRLAGSYQSILSNKEIILESAGSNLVYDIDFANGYRSHPILNDLVETNPSVAAFAMITIAGDITFASVNTSKELIAPFIEEDVIGFSFEKLLESYPLALGKTTFLPYLDEWVTPLYKVVRDKEGFPDGVALGLLRTNGLAEILDHPNTVEQNTTLLVLNSAGQHAHYLYDGSNALSDKYIPGAFGDFFSQIRQHIQQHHNLYLSEISLQSHIAPFKADFDKKGYIGVLGHIKNHEQWLIAKTPTTVVIQHFLGFLYVSCAAYIALLLLVYYLFWVIANAENKKRAALAHQAFHDELTGLPNRNYLIKHIVNWVNSRLDPFGLLYVDMDRFKNVNDNFGHLFGDQVLKVIASRLKLTLPEGSEIIRYGGDEFLILVAEYDPDRLREIARATCDQLADRYQIYGVSLELGCSIGIAKYPEDGHDFDALIRAADLAMYDAKRDKNTVRFFAENMLYERQRKIEIEHHLKDALADNEIFVVYQPQVTIDGELSGVESLVRWHNAELGPVSPNQFIPIAESSGLMPKIGNYVLHTAMLEMKQLQDITGTSFNASINVSLRQFMHEGFMDSLKQSIQETGFNNLCIVLEITENLFIDDIEYIHPLLTQIREMGMQVSMDDFGTGYSSLNILSSLPIDEIKIDKSFVDNIIDNDSARKMVKNIISIGKTYNMLVVAEGVESPQQFELLKAYGCDRFQGYYFSKPLIYDHLKTYVQKLPSNINDG